MERSRCGVRTSVWKALALGPLLLVWVPTGCRAQAVGSEAVVDGFVRAWNTHDMKGFGGVFTEDADWITVSGVRVKGRAEILSFLEKEHATWAKTTTFTATSTEERVVGADLAVIYFNWEITGAVDPQGKAAGPYRGISMFVAAKQADGWKVFAGQTTITRPAR